MTASLKHHLPLAMRSGIDPIPGSVLSLDVWLDRFSTELSRLRPHLGYTAANGIARILFSSSRQEPPYELARLAAEELAFMQEVDGPGSQRRG